MKPVAPVTRTASRLGIVPDRLAGKQREVLAALLRSVMPSACICSSLAAVVFLPDQHVRGDYRALRCWRRIENANDASVSPGAVGGTRILVSKIHYLSGGRKLH